MTRRRWSLFLITCLAVLALFGNVVLLIWLDRAQCRSTVRAIDNSRTMWLYLIDKNPGPEADEFRTEMDRRIPPAHCRGGTLVVDQADTNGEP